MDMEYGGVGLLGFVCSMITRPETPGRISSRVSAKLVMLNILRTRRECKTHEMSDRGTTFPTTRRLHSRLICKSGQSLNADCGFSRAGPTDSAAASSSASLGRRCPLCCFRSDWLCLVDEETRELDPAPKLPEPPRRLWVWLSAPKDDPL